MGVHAAISSAIPIVMSSKARTVFPVYIDFLFPFSMVVVKCAGMAALAGEARMLE